MPFRPTRNSRQPAPDVHDLEQSPLLPLDPLSPTFTDNPYPALAWLRDNEPVHRCTTGAWMITRYQDVYAALSDRRLSNQPASYAIVNDRNRERFACANVAANILPFMDAPVHTGLRKAITRVFHEHLQKFSLDVFELARTRLQAWLAHRELDVLEDFATPLSMDVMLALFGLPTSDAARLKQGCHWFFYLFAIMPSDDTRQQVDAGLIDFRSYFLRQISTRRRRPGEDLISALLSDPACAGFDDDILADTCMLLFADGIENVDAAIANAVYLLATHPAQWKRLRRNADLLPSAIEECLRLEAPAQFIARVAKEPIELHCKRVEPDNAVLLMLGSANRDQRKFADPDRFDISRQPETQLGFGRGRHSCIGARLVKAQMTAALTALMENCPRLATTRAPLVWEPRLGHRWLKYLVVTF